MLIDCICKAEAIVNKIIENKEAFFLITDSKNKDKLLKDEVRQEFMCKGLEVMYPPEYEAERTVLLKNVDAMIAALPVEEIAQHIAKQYKTKKIVKIPNSSHLLKVIFQSSETADLAVKDGLTIHFQKFDKRNIEEVFIPVVPCYRCYSYEHQKRACPKPEDYKICSNCSELGHTYDQCSTNILKCINCKRDHRTLAAKCSVRKGIIRSKINERRARSRSTVRGEKSVSQQTNIDLMRTKLPENYLAVMAATITIADKREAEVPGVFQYIVNEMLKANGIPWMQFPKSVISGYKTIEKESVETESKKRQRTDDECQVGYKRVEWAIMPDGTWGRITPHMTPILQSPARPPHITPTSTPAATPAPTPANTPSTTPLPTPSSSPQRSSGAILKTTDRHQQQQQHQKPKPQRESDQGLTLVVRNDVMLPPMNLSQMKKELNKEKTMKVVYTNTAFPPQLLKKNIKLDKYDLLKTRRIPLVLEHFNQIRSGGLYGLENLEKIEKK